MEGHNKVAQIQNIYNTYVLLMPKPVCEKGEPERLLPIGGTWVNFCWVCAAGLSEPLPHYSLFCGQL